MNKHIVSILRTPNCHYFLVAFMNDKGIIEEALFDTEENLCNFLVDYFYIPDWEK